ncbi:MAG: PH domain-containing protein [Beijerinckiaceae bacterium]
MRFAPAVFRPVFGRGLVIAVAVLVLLFLVLLVIESGPSALLRGVWPGLLAVAAAWAVFWRPAVVVEESAITVRNVFRTHRVPWAAIQRLDTKWALTIHTEQGRVGAWAAPAPTRYAVSSVDPNDIRVIAGAALPPGDAVRPGDTLATASGAAAFVIHRHWSELREEGRLDVDPAARRVRTTWDWPVGTVLGALLVATVVVALI